jgi:plastocyanin domain-containing protein
MNRNLLRIARALCAVLLVSAFAGCGGEKNTTSETTTTTSETPAPVAAGGAQEIQLTVTDAGFEPAQVTVEKDRPIALTITRKTEQTCAKDIVFKGMDVKKDLPLNEAVRIELPAQPSGTVEYACGMDMIKGSLVVQ